MIMVGLVVASHGRLADELVAAELAEREKLEQVLREAEAKATTLRFEVGPPPRNVTRNARITGP